MVQTPIKPIDLDTFLRLPETKPASEFIVDRIIQKPMPQGKHSTIQGDLGSALNIALKPDRIARAYPELRCTFGGRSTVPDLAVFTWERIPRDNDGKVANIFALAPDWTIEILSPEQSQSKVVRNILHSLEKVLHLGKPQDRTFRSLSHGTQMGWLIDPGEELVFVYLADRTISVFDRDDLLPVPDFARSVQLSVAQLFSWLEG
jgi:Uma2 family endonuclease